MLFDGDFLKKKFNVKKKLFNASTSKIGPVFVKKCIKFLINACRFIFSQIIKVFFVDFSTKKKDTHVLSFA